MSEEVRKIKKQTTVETIMTQNSDKLLEKVQEKITLCEHRLLFDGTSEPSMYDLNKAIAEHAHANLGLISMYELAAWDLQIAKHSFEEFWAEKIEEARSEHNKHEDPKSKWLSISELESIVRSRHKVEIAELNLKIAIAERQKSTMLRLLEGWEKYSWQLMQISKNNIAEIQSHLKSNSEFNPND